MFINDLTCYTCGTLLLGSPSCVCTVMTRWSNLAKIGADMEHYHSLGPLGQHEYVQELWRIYEGLPPEPDCKEPADTF